MGATLDKKPENVIMREKLRRLLDDMPPLTEDELRSLLCEPSKQEEEKPLGKGETE